MLSTWQTSVNGSDEVSPQRGGWGLQIGADPESLHFAGVLWIATARNNTTSGGSVGNKNDRPTRTATSVFLRGLAEKYMVSTSGSSAFVWRRIVFFMKGQVLRDPLANNPSPIYLYNQDLNNSTIPLGYTRHNTYVYGPNVPDDNSEYRARLAAVLFKGQVDVDWSDILTAKVDTSRVSLAYDKVMHVRTGNESGVMQVRKFWHPVNKLLTYDDDEIGGGVASSHYSTDSKMGCGDMYVFDYVQASPDASEGESITFVPESTLYWHER